MFWCFKVDTKEQQNITVNAKSFAPGPLPGVWLNTCKRNGIPLPHMYFGALNYERTRNILKRFSSRLGPTNCNPISVCSCNYTWLLLLLVVTFQKIARPVDPNNASRSRHHLTPSHPLGRKGWTIRRWLHWSKIYSNQLSHPGYLLIPYLLLQ